MSWQDFGSDGEQYDDDTPALTLGDVKAGQRTALRFDAEPEQFESDQYGEGVRVEATFGSSEHDFDFEMGEDVVLVTWSSRLVRALADFATQQDGIVGESCHIAKYGSGYDVEYEVTPAEDDIEDDA